MTKKLLLTLLFLALLTSCGTRNRAVQNVATNREEVNKSAFIDAVLRQDTAFLRKKLTFESA